MDLKQQIRANRLAGIGSALMALDQGRVPDLSGYMANHAALQGQLPMGDGGTIVDGGYESQDLTKNADLMGRFTPEQQALLAQMPRSAALKVIEKAVFAAPDPAAQFVKKTLGGGPGMFTPEQQAALAALPPEAAQKIIVDRMFAKPEAAPERKVIKGADGYNYFQDSGERVLPNVVAEPKAAPDRPMKEGADGRLRYTDGEKELVFPDIDTGSGKDMTESERRIFMFNSMQKQTGPAINLIEQNGFDPSNIQDKLANGVLGGNFFRSTEGQMYEASAGAWSESALRLATGAAATPQEYDRIRGMYFAQAGDSPETINFKRKMRESYQGVLSATLTGGELPPSPLTFAVEQFYNQGSEPAPSPDPAAAEPPEGSWNGPTLGEVKGMDPASRAAMLSAYPDISVIPDDILDFLIEEGGI
jgi:hypothetical protein